LNSGGLPPSLFVTQPPDHAMGRPLVITIMMRKQPKYLGLPAPLVISNFVCEVTVSISDDPGQTVTSGHISDDLGLAPRDLGLLGP
jgi:hypothetical protein